MEEANKNRTFLKRLGTPQVGFALAQIATHLTVNFHKLPPLKSCQRDCVMLLGHITISSEISGSYQMHLQDSHDPARSKHF